MNLERIKNNRFINFLEKHEKGIFLFFTMFFCLLYYISYSIHNIPYTNGWGNGYADLIFSGKFPYRDFYYYLPPLNLIIDCIFWKLSFGKMFIYVLFRLAERMLAIFLAYKLLCKVAKPRYACIGVVLGAIFHAATVYDIVGDYNQTSLLLVLLLAWIYLKFIETSNDEKTNKKQYKYLLLGGVLLGISFLHKQTIFLAECIIFFTVLTIYFIVTHKKKYFYSLLISLLGFIIPISIASIILLLNGAFLPFIDQVYLNVDAKGSIISIIGSIFTACFKTKYIIMTILIGLYLYLSRFLRNRKFSIKKENIIKTSIRIVAIIIIFSIGIFIFKDYIKILDIYIALKLTGFFAVNILALIILDFITEKFLHRDNILEYILIFTIMAFATSFIYCNKFYAFILYLCTTAFSFLTMITSIATLSSIVLIIYLFYRYCKTKDIKLLMWIFLLAGGLAYEYNGIMGTAILANNYAAMLLISVLVAYILSNISCKERVIKFLILVFCIFVPTTAMSQKVISTYKWWGWKDSIINSTKFNTIDVPGLEGFRVSENVKNMYEQMYKVIKSNSDENSVIYGFPHIRIFNVLLNNTNMNHFVPVPFYDVCSDKYMEADIKQLKETPPDIVIWVDIPDCMETHEETYRDNKKLVQRKFQEWFSESVKNGEYTLIGQYDSMFIYKINDGSEINYTYYKSPEEINETLNEI